MKAFLLTSLLGIIALSSSAFAQSLNCAYLESADGVYAPGLSRPQVLVEHPAAEVLLYLEGGGGFSSSEHFPLSLVSSSQHQRIYSHPEVQLVTSLSLNGSIKSAKLTVRGLKANCAR